MAGFFFCSGSNASVASAGIGVTHVLRPLIQFLGSAAYDVSLFSYSGVGRG